MGRLELGECMEDRTKNLLTSWNQVNSKIAGVFAVAIIAIFPLVFRDYYYDILKVKYIFYYGSVILMTLVTLIVAIFFLWKDKTSYGWHNFRKIISNLKIKNIRNLDWAVLAFAAATAISTIQSEYFYESFWGNEGRFMGMFLVIMYTISYFVISRFLKFKQWYLDIFLVSGMIACLIGILQYFLYDPIGFKNTIDLKYYDAFTSTIGNINTYTSYVSLIFGVSVILYLIEINIFRKLWYLSAIIISIFALITGISDNAYLAMAALFGLLPLYLFKNVRGVKQYLFLLSILLTEFWIIDVINRVFPEHVLGINGLFNVITDSGYLLYLLTILWGITIFFQIIEVTFRNRSIMKTERSIGIWLWLCFLILIILSGCYILYDVNIADNIGKYGSIEKYLIINDDWGTYRGYIWRIGLESYEKFPIIHKVFGYGPDTFGIITVKNYYEEMISRYNEKFDSAHNEYLQYLITIGIAGLIAYLSLIMTSIKEMIRSSKKVPALMAIVFAVVCYSAQATVNISVPIVSPIMMTLLMIGASAVLSSNAT